MSVKVKTAIVLPVSRSAMAVTDRLGIEMRSARTVSSAASEPVLTRACRRLAVRLEPDWSIAGMEAE